MATDVIVVGGGAIGCSVAYHLLQRGLSVTVVEREHAGAGASSVAAGMLAAQVETAAPDAMYDLCLTSRAMFPALAAQLREETGLDMELVQRGILQPAFVPARAEELRERAQWQQARGQRALWLDPAQVCDALPGLSEAVLGGLFLPDDAQVNSPCLMQALRAGVVRRGGELREGTAVTGFRRSGARVTGVRTSAGELAAGEVVLAAGAWSGAVAALAGLTVPVVPVKGQLLGVSAPEWGGRTTLFSHGVYAVPKSGGHLVLGATEEPEAGFDARPTLGAAARIGGTATQELPALAGRPLVAHYVGLRPGSPDRKPMLGRVPGVEGLVLATGHFRNGILLSPVTGAAIAALLTGGAPPLDLAAFAPGRCVTVA